MLLEEHRCHFVKTASPGEELVCGSRGNVRLDVTETGSLQVFTSLHDSVRIFLASAAHENAVNLIPVLDVCRSICAAAEEAIVSEGLRTGKSDTLCLNSSH